MTKRLSLVSRTYGRRLAFVRPSPTFLIVTEGSKTERQYFVALRNRLKLTAAEVDIKHPEGTDPRTLVNYAISKRDERKRESRRNNLVAEYDEVWVVFDLERIHDERRKLAPAAIMLAKNSGINLAISDPCFEYWLLIHHEFTTSPFEDCDSVIQRLKRHQSYAKNIPIPTTDDILNLLGAAIRNSERCRQCHFDAASDGNPSTDVDFLALKLNQAARLHLQIKLD